MVKVTVEKIPESQVRLNIEVEPERIEQSVEKAYRRLVGRINVPGFRKGKAPRHIVERLVGKETLFAEGIEQLLNDVYREAVKEHDLHPIDQPEVDLEPKAEDLKPGESLLIKATVPVRPTVELGDYRSIRMPRVAVEVTPEEVNRIVESLQEQQTQWAPVEREARVGDRVSMDVHGEVGTYAKLYSPSGEPIVQSGTGQTIVDEQQAEYAVEEDSDRYAPGFAEQVVGMKPGQEKQFELSLPANYQDPDLSGKMAIFKVKVHEVREKHAPAIDDELAKSVGYESLEQMREDLRQRAQARAVARANEVHEEAVIAEAINRSTYEIPPALVNHEIDHLIEHARDNLRQQRLELDDYLRLTRKSEPELREEFREQAIRNVKTALLIDRIAEQEHIEVEPAEVDREIDILTVLAGKEGDRVRQSLAQPTQREALERRIRNRKVIDTLLKIAETVEAAEGEQPETPAEVAQPAEQAEATVPAEAAATEATGGEATPEANATPTEAATTEQGTG